MNYNVFMTFIIKKFEAFSDNKKIFHDFIDGCDKINLKPLILTAKKKFLETFFDNVEDYRKLLEEPRQVQYRTMRTRSGQIVRRRIVEPEQDTLTGEIFFMPRKQGLVYIYLIHLSQLSPSRIPEDLKHMKFRVEIGYFYDDSKIEDISEIFNYFCSVENLNDEKW